MIAMTELPRNPATHVWAAFVQRTEGLPWRLEGLSTQSADRARALVERDHARQHVVAARYIVRRYEASGAVPWSLDPSSA